MVAMTGLCCQRDLGAVGQGADLHNSNGLPLKRALFYCFLHTNAEQLRNAQWILCRSVNGPNWLEPEEYIHGRW